MNSRIIAIIIALASLLAAVPDSAGRWFYLQRVAQEINLLTRAQAPENETQVPAPADSQNDWRSMLQLINIARS